MVMKSSWLSHVGRIARNPIARSVARHAFNRLRSSLSTRAETTGPDQYHPYEVRGVGSHHSKRKDHGFEKRSKKFLRQWAMTQPLQIFNRRNCFALAPGNAYTIGTDSTEMYSWNQSSYQGDDCWQLMYYSQNALGTQNSLYTASSSNPTQVKINGKPNIQDVKCYVERAHIDFDIHAAAIASGVDVNQTQAELTIYEMVCRKDAVANAYIESYYVLPESNTSGSFATLATGGSSTGGDAYTQGRLIMAAGEVPYNFPALTAHFKILKEHKLVLAPGEFKNLRFHHKGMELNGADFYDPGLSDTDSSCFARKGITKVYAFWLKGMPLGTTTTTSPGEIVNNYSQPTINIAYTKTFYLRPVNIAQGISMAIN